MGQIAQVGLDRGISWEVDEYEVFKSPSGVPVYVGAMGVDKSSSSEGGLLRFVSIWCPVNHFLPPLEGDAKRLPYLGHALLILLAEGESALTDSEDLQSCFNLFAQPESWKGFGAFEKLVSGKVQW